MDISYSNDNFYPYDSFETYYSERVLPEFGLVKSPYIKNLDSWRFFLAQTSGDIPFDFEGNSFDDSVWDIINVPSTWQTEGYGLPQNLLHDYPDYISKNRKNRSKEESISHKIYENGTSSEGDSIGIYRTEFVLTPEEYNRAIYLEMSGICGSFEVYLNEKLILSSHSVLTEKRLLLSTDAVIGVNTLVILVNQYDRDKNGKIIKELANFGFSGIFRPLKLCFESLLEMSNLHIVCDNVPNAYVNQLVDADVASERQNIARISRGDYMVKMDLKITNHTDIMMPFAVRVSILEARGEYDPYKMPYVKLNIEKNMEGVCDAKSQTVTYFQAIAINTAQWSDATPVQYDVVFELLDSAGRVIEVKRKRFGFRTTEVILKKLNINERRIPLLMTKYYEFDPVNGIAVPLARMRQDIILMKRCGINAVICKSYPLSSDFLSLCDQYGIYVFALSDSRYMIDYTESAMLHPCVVAWGFSDYKNNIDKCIKVKEECLKLDSSRPWYMAEDMNGAVSDFPEFPNEAGIVFGPWQDICLDRKSVFGKNKLGKNLLLTVPGRTHFDDDDADYKWIHQADLEGEKSNIASSIGQGIVDAERNPHPIYFDIKKQCQMLSIFPNSGDSSYTLRNIHPFAFMPEMLLEWKLMLGGMVILSGSGLIDEIEPYGTRNMKFPLNAGKYMVEGWGNNNSDFSELYKTALSHELVFDISLKLYKDGFYAPAGYEMAFYQEIIANECANPDGHLEVNQSVLIPAAKSNSFSGFDGDLPILAVPETVEEVTEVVAEENSAEGSIIEESGTEEVVPDEVSIDSVEEIKEEVSEVSVLQEVPLDEIGEVLSEDSSEETSSERKVYGLPRGIIVNKGNLSIGFDRKIGSVNHLCINKFDILAGGFKPSFYRCPSNIDRTDKSFVLAKTIFSKETDYEGIQESLEFVKANYGEKDNVFSIAAEYKSFAVKDKLILFYEFTENKLKITLDFTPRYDLVRYGIRVPIVKNGIMCQWYGRGPGESYYDRKEATKIGLYSAEADKIYHPYARPAENSSHYGTQVLVLKNGAGEGIKVTRSNGIFEFTCLPFTPEQMNEYLHEEQLMQNDCCELFLDFCTREIERTADNFSVLALNKNTHYRETFEIEAVYGE